MSEPQAAELCGPCIVTMRKAGAVIEILYVAKFGVCEECGAEHGSNGRGAGVSVIQPTMETTGPRAGETEQS